MSVLIPVVLGTGRVDRQSEKIARFVYSELSSFVEVSAKFVDVRDYVLSPFTIPAWVEDEKASKWRKIAQEASGFVFVVPEYNHSFPGELKLLLDYAYKEYFGKPVALVGVASGKYGGARAIEHMLAVVTGLKMVTTPCTLTTSDVQDRLAQDADADKEYREFTKTMLEQLVSLSKKLKSKQ